MSMMSTYKKGFYQLRLYINQQSEQDRIITLSATLLIILFLWYLLLYGPMSDQLELSLQKIAELQKSSAELMQKKKIFESVLSDPNTSSLMARHQELVQQIKNIATQTRQYNHRYINQKDLYILLHDLLKQTMGVAIVDFSTIPTPIVNPPHNNQTNGQEQPNTEATQNSASTSSQRDMITPSHYRLVIKGTYFPIMNYLHRLEQLRWNLYWDKFDYVVQTYPDAIATIEFFTLRPETKKPGASLGGKQ